MVHGFYLRAVEIDFDCPVACGSVSVTWTTLRRSLTRLFECHQDAVQRK